MKFLVEDKQHVYWNPYFGGFLLGLLVIATFYITGRGIGASGAVKSTVVATVSTIAPDHAENSAFYSRYLKGAKGPLNSLVGISDHRCCSRSFLFGSRQQPIGI
jgi:hypothetical protein